MASQKNNIKRPNKYIDNNREDGDNEKEDMCDKSNVAKKFDAILECIKNNKKVTELICIKSCGKNINLHTVITKFINAKTTVLEGDYGFDEAIQKFHQQKFHQQNHSLHLYNNSTNLLLFQNKFNYTLTDYTLK